MNNYINIYILIILINVNIKSEVLKYFVIDNRANFGLLDSLSVVLLPDITSCPMSEFSRVTITTKLDQVTATYDCNFHSTVTKLGIESVTSRTKAQ